MITVAQCRAARALLDWSREDLAAASKVSLRTIVDFERGARVPRELTLDAIERALAAAGVQFIPENGGGAGVRLAKPSGGSRATPDEMEASAAEVRSQAARAADEAMSDMDATRQEKAHRRAALTDEAALVERARGRGKPERGNQ